MRTNWGKRAHGAPVELLPEYEESVGAGMKRFETIWGNENVDPSRVAQVVLRVAEAKSLPAHLLLGSDAFDFARQAEIVRTEQMDQFEAVSRSTDFAAEGPIPDMPG